jgi:hypothetical protein
LILPISRRIIVIIGRPFAVSVVFVVEVNDEMFLVIVSVVCTIRPAPVSHSAHSKASLAAVLRMKKSVLQKDRLFS